MRASSPTGNVGQRKGRYVWVLRRLFMPLTSTNILELPSSSPIAANLEVTWNINVSVLPSSIVPPPYITMIPVVLEGENVTAPLPPLVKSGGSRG